MPKGAGRVTVSAVQASKLPWATIRFWKSLPPTPQSTTSLHKTQPVLSATHPASNSVALHTLHLLLTHTHNQSYSLPLDTNPPFPFHMAEFFLGGPSETPTTLKRRASSTFDSRGDNSRKRLKEDLLPNETTDPQAPALISGSQLADDLEQELVCGCCSALLYRPVIVYPCQHYFCGR